MKISSKTTRIGEFVIDGPIEQDIDVFGQSPAKQQTTGTANAYSITGPDGIELVLHDTNWKDGVRGITTFETTGNRAIERLERALSLGIRNHGSLQFCELRQARITDQGSFKPWSQLFKASPFQLNQGAGMNVFEVLKQEGASAIGTKENLLGETNRRRKMLCATFHPSTHMFPSVVYLLTRVIPLSNGFLEIDA